MSDKKHALLYHQFPKPGKISVTPSKSLLTTEELALAYSPGVAHPCLEIHADPLEAAKYTARNNLVAVISNGTAVLGLGNIGPLAAKPVMEGKGVLFKKFAGVDVFDLEVNETDPDIFIQTVQALEPTFGGINLEDIAAPHCFYIEEELKKRLNIPVFHDDQHGTAIIVVAAILNAVKLTDKKLEALKIVVNGAGAAAMACMKLLEDFGVARHQFWVFDRTGLLHADRNDLDAYKQAYARVDANVTLAEALRFADVFIGVSAGNILSAEMVASMPANPIIMALANPVPEVMPSVVKEVRDDAIIATGRSDFPNQVNNVLCFPYIFRGALDVGATEINVPMKKAAVKALINMTHSAGGCFSRDYIIPNPFDNRLLPEVAFSVAKAAIESGVAQLPYTNEKTYKRKLYNLMYQTGFHMAEVLEKAKANYPVVAFTNPDNPKVLETLPYLLEEKLLSPLLITRHKEAVMEKLKAVGVTHDKLEHVAFSPPEAGQSVRAHGHELYTQGACQAVITGPETDGQVAVSGPQIAAIVHDNVLTFIATYEPQSRRALENIVTAVHQALALFDMEPRLLFTASEANRPGVESLLGEFPKESMRRASNRCYELDEALFEAHSSSQRRYATEADSAPVIMVDSALAFDAILKTQRALSGSKIIGPWPLLSAEVYAAEATISVRGLYNLAVIAAARATGKGDKTA